MLDTVTDKDLLNLHRIQIIECRMVLKRAQRVLKWAHRNGCPCPRTLEQVTAAIRGKSLEKNYE